ncbi:MAG TPA: FtsX-like permease family protein, partial [Parafilimonas sp.]|nr:FtsX-like permease family protein [Parafilimonas sp.]
RQKLFSLLNIFGLALALASAMFIFLYVSDELRYDTIQPHYKDTYRIGTTYITGDGQHFDNTVAPGYFLRYLKDNRKDDILYTTRTSWIGYPTALNYKPADKIVLTEEIRWAEPGFDKVIYFDLLKGNKEKMFANDNTIALSETGARRIFGNTDPMGKIISLKHFFATQNRDIDLMVTGVYKDYPSNSHFKPEYIVNLNAMRTIQGEHFNDYMEGSRFDQYVNFFEDYVVLKPNTNLQSINTTLNSLANQMIQTDSFSRVSGAKFLAFTTKLSDLHFDPKVEWENNTRGNKSYLNIFSIIAVMIMLIACINYTNLATARSVKRSKEVGLRKSFGSNRKQIALQFFLESFIMTLCALILSFILVLAFLHPFNQLANKSFSIASIFQPHMMAIVSGVVLFMTVASGLYPAVYLSRFKPVQVLKGQLVKGKRAEFFRKSLVTVQYTVALGLVIYTFIVIRQMEELKNTKLNEQGSQLLAVRFGGTATQDKFEVFRQSVLQDPEIQHVTLADHLPRLDYFGTNGTQVKFPELGNKDLRSNIFHVDYDFAKTFDIEFIAGRDFQYGNVNDSTSVILNQATVKALGKPLDKIIGATMIDSRDNMPYKVIGVVKDFPYQSMHHAIDPLIITPHNNFFYEICYVKLPPGKFQEKIAAIEKKWKAVYPGTGFSHWFVNDEFNRMYIAEDRVLALAKVFAALSIIITIMGVFSLASYTAEQRTKEVGIRKVLGAGDKHVAALFAWMFVKIFLIASVLAIPLSWFFGNKWLQGFVYRTPINPLIFILSLLGLFLITFLTVGYEIWRSVRAKPVIALRSE